MAGAIVPVHLMKDLVLLENLCQHVAPALEELARESVTEVSPALFPCQGDGYRGLSRKGLRSSFCMTALQSSCNSGHPRE